MWMMLATVGMGYTTMPLFGIFLTIRQSHHEQDFNFLGRHVILSLEGIIMLDQKEYWETAQPVNKARAHETE